MGNCSVTTVVQLCVMFLDIFMGYFMGFGQMIRLFALIFPREVNEYLIMGRNRHLIIRNIWILLGFVGLYNLYK